MSSICFLIVCIVSRDSGVISGSLDDFPPLDADTLSFLDLPRADVDIEVGVYAGK